jgi:probable phosphoglycerate mutase
MSATPVPAAAPAALLMIRHGETEWNAQSRIQGHIDVDLSERGRRQAQALARYLSGTPLAAVVTSDLARAHRTAQPLADARGIAAVRDARLRERAFGLFEGSTYAEAQASWPHEYAIWQRREPGHAVPGGESFLAMRERVLDCLGELARRHAGETVAVVTHGGVLDIVYRTAHAIPWETPRSHLLPNACVNRVAAAWRGGRLSLEVLSWAQSDHLEPARDELA